MSEFEIIQADVMQWASEYDGPKFHACLCDPPYELSFMGKSWDSRGIAFRPETWAAIGEHLHPGAFLMAFGSTRGWHRLACAIEDAGFLIQPSVFVHGVGVVDCAPLLYHVCGQAFPKSSRIDAQIEKRRNDDIRPVCRFLRAEMEKRNLVSRDIASHFDFHPRMIDHWAARDTDSQPAVPTWEQWQQLKTLLDFGDEMDAEVKRLNDRKGKLGELWYEREVIGKGTAGLGKGHPAHDGGFRADYWETAPATPLARAWAGHRYGGQILRDLSLPVVVAQKPWTGRRLDCIVETGAGAMNVDGARVATGDTIIPSGEMVQVNRVHEGYQRPNRSMYVDKPKERGGPANPSGRWPPNCIFTHHPACQPILVPAPCPACSGTGGSDGNGGACGRCGGSGEVEVGAVERVKGTAPSGPNAGTKTGQAVFTDYNKVHKPGDLKAKDYAAPDGTEPVPRYRCARHCPDCGCWWLSEDADVCPECGGSGEWGCAVRRLGEDSGELSTGGGIKRKAGDFDRPGGWKERNRSQSANYQSTTGTAARFFPTPDFSHETAERLALGQTRKYAAKPAPREKSAGLERFVWRKGKSGHTRIWSDAAVDEFWHWQQERKGLPGEGFDKWLEACGESKRKVHKIPYTWGNIHPTVKSIALTTWLSILLLPPDIYAPRRLLIPFCGTFSEGVGGQLAGWEHITGIDSDPQACWQAESRAKFWQGWSAATGETEVKPILKAAKKAQKAPGQTPQPPTPQPHQLPMEVAV